MQTGRLFFIFLLALATRAATGDAPRESAGDPAAAAAAEELRAHRERVVEPQSDHWAHRPAPARLLCTTAWVGAPGAMTLAQFKEYVDNAARAGFHVLSLGITWKDVELRPGQYDLAFHDNAITYAANQGMWVQVRLVTRPLPEWIQGGLTQVDHRGEQSVVPVFTDAGLNARMAEFYRAMARRYKGYPILTYSSAFSEAAETEYHMGGLWRDFSAPAVTHFRRFLEHRYPNLEALNNAWGTLYSAWDEARIEFNGEGLPSHPARYTDWMRQRETALRELNDQLAHALTEGDPAAEYAVQCGRIYSRECAWRGTVGLGGWGGAADWVITDPAPRDDVRWQSAVCLAFGRNAVSELDGLYAYDRDGVDPMTVIPRQVRDGFAAGVRMMQLCHWYPKDVAKYPD
ncbi:MAG: beta-galactosidase, partial [bacterium]|nr:beta-galactosidase [bacterium]